MNLIESRALRIEIEFNVATKQQKKKQQQITLRRTFRLNDFRRTVFIQSSNR